MPSPKQYQVANLTSRFTTVNDKANSAFDIANSAYAQANAATSTGGGGYTQANNAYTQANAAYSQANTAYGQANAAYGQANAAYSQANTAYSQANNAYAQANAAYSQGNSAYGQANAAYGAANTAQTTAQNAYGQANTATTNAGNAYSQANLAYTQANNAYLAANNSNLKSGGVISGTLNVTNDIIVGGNVYLQGNTTFINVSTYQVNDSLMYIAANNILTDSIDIGFVGGKNTSGTFSHTGFARDATDGKYKLFDKLSDSGHVGNVIDFANTSLATLVANVEANTLTVVNGVSGNVNFDSGTLFVDSVNNRVGIGTDDPRTPLYVRGDGTANNARAVIRIDNTGSDKWSFISLPDAASGNDTSANNYYLIGRTSTFSNRTLSFHIPTASDYGSGSQPQIGFYSTGADLLFSVQATTGNAYVKGNIGIANTAPAVRLQIGNLSSTSTATPETLSLGGTFSSTAGANPKIRVWTDGANTMGFGVSSDQLDYIGTGSYSHVFYTNGSARMRITGGGNVGIGTSPENLLHLYGASNPFIRIQAGGGSYSYLRLDDGGTSNGYLIKNTGADISNGALAGALYTYTDNNKAFQHIHNGVPLFTILSNGNVGINTTSPSSRLDIAVSSTMGTYGPGTYNLRLRNTNTAETNSGAVEFIGHSGNATTPYPWATISAEKQTSAGDANYGGKLHLWTTSGGANGEANSGQYRRLTIDSAGNVGIGTTSPISKTTITRAVTNTVTLADSNNASHLTLAGSDALVRLQLGCGGASLGYAGWIQASYDNTGGAFGLEPLLLNPSGGNVGIGTTNPSYKLDVTGAIRATTEVFSTRNAGNTGFISLTSGSGSNMLPMLNGVSENNGLVGFYFIVNKSANQSAVTGYTAGAFRFTTDFNQTSGLLFAVDNNYSNRFAIDYNGNIGIGTTSPDTKLHIYHAGQPPISDSLYASMILDTDSTTNYQRIRFDVGATPYWGIMREGTTNNFGISGRINGSWSDNVLTITPSAGNVGIATANPGQKLHVEGKVLINAGTGASTFDDLNIGGISGWSNTEAHRINFVYGSASSPSIFTTIESKYNGSTNLAELRFKNMYNSGVGTATIMALFGSGFVGINIESPYETGDIFRVQGVSAFVNSNAKAMSVGRNSSTGTLIEFFYNGAGGKGTISTDGTNVAYNTSSDRRLKLNIQPADSASSVIDNIQVVKHDWNTGKHTRYGVVAQDLYEVAPEAVSVGDPEDVETLRNPWGVDYSKLVPMLIKEIQELRARVALLESK